MRIQKRIAVGLGLGLSQKNRASNCPLTSWVGRRDGFPTEVGKITEK